jgi:glycosyltransferase involved in cell wall biosynthesis
VAVLGAHWRRFALETLRVPDERLLTVENGVPEPPALANPVHRPAHLVFAGTLGERKGVDVLLESLSLLDARTRHWRATLAGGGEVEGFRRRAEEIGIAAKLEFPGWLSETQVGALMASADLFVLPSRAENQPIAILEAMARGLPVVSTTVGAIPEQVRDGVSGLLVPPGDAAALALALGRLIEDPVERAAMGQAGRARFLQRYSIERCAEAFLSVYARMRGL